MKQEWKDPRIDVQRFIPSEYVASCLAFESGIVVTGSVSGILTDCMCKPDNEPDDWTPPLAWQSPDWGFNDDHFDYLSGDDDCIPGNGKDGWYSDTNVFNDLPDKLKALIHKDYIGQIATLLEEFTTDGAGFGNTKAGDLSKTVYYWGNWPSQITEDNCKEYNVGPNGS